MAVLKGKDGSISAGLNNLANITSFTINEEADTLETTAMGNAGYKTFVGSLKSWSGTVEAVFDDTDTAIQVGGAITLTVLVDDGSSAQVQYSGDCIVTSRSVEVGVADLVGVTFEVTGTGALTETIS
tara:strand:+ start:244 stop:624 length:381 start_codon:yes stop_codon:yes gene_type:complete